MERAIGTRRADTGAKSLFAPDYKPDFTRLAVPASEADFPSLRMEPNQINAGWADVLLD
jgi:hypothetical protein